jgi:alanine racemase
LNEKHKFTTPKGYALIGRVSMDSMSINSDDDSICLFDNANVLADIIDTINYDILVKLKSNIKRVVI